MHLCSWPHCNRHTINSFMMMINLPLRTSASSQSVGLATVYSRMHSRHEKHKTVSKHRKRTIVIEHMQVKYRIKDECEISNRIFFTKYRENISRNVCRLITQLFMNEADWKKVSLQRQGFTIKAKTWSANLSLRTSKHKYNIVFLTLASVTCWYCCCDSCVCDASRCGR